jgi:hypothetical protein
VVSHGRKGHKEPLLKLTNVEPALGVETLGNGVRVAEAVFWTFLNHFLPACFESDIEWKKTEGRGIINVGFAFHRSTDKGTLSSLHEIVL